jgi:hypothetical protein
MRQDGRLVRHSALHPLGFAERKKSLSAEARRAKAEKTAYPAPMKNTGDDAWLFEI